MGKLLFVNFRELQDKLNDKVKLDQIELNKLNSLIENAKLNINQLNSKTDSNLDSFEKLNSLLTKNSESTKQLSEQIHILENDNSILKTNQKKHELFINNNKEKELDQAKEYKNVEKEIQDFSYKLSSLNDALNELSNTFNLHKNNYSKLELKQKQSDEENLTKISEMTNTFNDFKKQLTNLYKDLDGKIELSGSNNSKNNEKLNSELQRLTENNLTTSSFIVENSQKIVEIQNTLVGLLQDQELIKNFADDIVHIKDELEKMQEVFNKKLDKVAELYNKKSEFNQQLSQDSEETNRKIEKMQSLYETLAEEIQGHLNKLNENNVDISNSRVRLCNFELRLTKEEEKTTQSHNRMLEHIKQLATYEEESSESNKAIIDEVNSKISSLEQNLANYSKSINQLEENNTNNNNEVTKLNQKLTQLHNNHNEASQNQSSNTIDNSFYEKSTNEMNDRISKLKTKQTEDLESINNKISVLEDSISKIHHEIIQLSNSKKDETQHVDENENEDQFKRINEDIENLKSNLEVIKPRIELLSKDLQENKDFIKNSSSNDKTDILEQKLKQEVEKLNQLEEKLKIIDSHEKENSTQAKNLEESIGKMQNDNNNLLMKINVIAEEKNSLIKELNVLSGKLNNINQDLTEKIHSLDLKHSQEIPEIKEMYENKETKVTQELQHPKKLNESMAHNLPNDQIVNLTTNVDDNCNLIKSLKEDINLIKNDIIRLNIEIKQTIPAFEDSKLNINNQIHEVDAKINGLNTKIADLNNHINLSNINFEEAEHKIINCTADIDDFKKKQDLINSEHKGNEKLIKVEIEKVNHRITSIENGLNNAIKSNESYITDDQCRSNLSKLKDELSLLISDNIKLIENKRYITDDQCKNELSELKGELSKSIHNNIIQDIEGKRFITEDNNKLELEKLKSELVNSIPERVVEFINKNKHATEEELNEVKKSIINLKVELEKEINVNVSKISKTFENYTTSSDTDKQLAKLKDELEKQINKKISDINIELKLITAELHNTIHSLQKADSVNNDNIILAISNLEKQNKEHEEKFNKLTLEYEKLNQSTSTIASEQQKVEDKISKQIKLQQEKLEGNSSVLDLLKNTITKIETNMNKLSETVVNLNGETRALVEKRPNEINQLKGSIKNTENKKENSGNINLSNLNKLEEKLAEIQHLKENFSDLEGYINEIVDIKDKQIK